MADTTTPTTTKPKPTQQAVSGDPGYGLGIAGFIVSFFVGVAGLIMSAIALNQSKEAGKKNALAFAGLIIGIIKTALDVLAIIGMIIGFSWLVGYCADNPDECSETGSSRFYDDYRFDSGDATTINTY